MTRRVAVVQMTSVPGQAGRNLVAVEERIRHAAGEGATLVALPECAINGYDLAWIRSGAPGGQFFPDRTFDRIISLSSELGTAVVLADLERADGRLHDSGLIFEAGRVVSCHRKVIPTQREVAAGVVPGDTPAVPQYLGGARMVVAPMVCYEYAFPEIARDLARAGAQLLAVSAAVRVGYEHLIPVRLRARAQDNACFVLMANAVGHGFCGRSVIISPHGVVMAEASGRGDEIIFADLDPAGVDDVGPDALPSNEEHAKVMSVLLRRQRVGRVSARDQR